MIHPDRIYRSDELKGKTISGIDYRRIEYTTEEIHHARAMVASFAVEKYGRTEAEDTKEILEHLGLLPYQETKWFEWRKLEQSAPDSTERGTQKKSGRPGIGGRSATQEPVSETGKVTANATRRGRRSTTRPDDQEKGTSS